MKTVLQCSAIILFMTGALLTARSQDIHFSQFFEAPLLRNPSLAGIFTGDVRVQAVYRDQWNSFTNAYRTGSLNGEYKMPVGRDDDFLTAGLQMLFDRAGTAGLTTTQLLPAFNYHKSLSNEKSAYLSLGFMGGMVRKSIDVSKMTTNNQYGGGGYDPAANTGETFSAPVFTTWDMSVGMSYNAGFGAGQLNSLFFGIAWHHLNRPENSFYRDPAIELSPKYVFSAGVKWQIDDYAAFTLHADHSIQGSFSETIGGVLYSYNLGGYADDPDYTIHAGAFLRWRDAVIPVLKIDFHPLSVAISYDVNVSQLKTASMGRGGFELSMAYTGLLNRNSGNPYDIRCPRF